MNFSRETERNENLTNNLVNETEPKKRFSQMGRVKALKRA